jgi:hypothetical protein
MKKHWITYSPTQQFGPMAFWVHIETDGKSWYGADTFDPPLPAVVPGRGYALYYVEFDSALLWFSSLDEIRVCIETLSQKALPSNTVLSQKRGAGYGPSRHWLNRIPLRSIAWPYRQRVVKYMKTALADFEKQVPMAKS